MNVWKVILLYMCVSMCSMHGIQFPLGPGTPLRDLLNTTSLRTCLIESKVCLLEPEFQSNIQSTFTMLDAIEDKWCSVLDTVLMIESSLDIIEQNITTLESSTDAIEVNINNVASDLDTIRIDDFGGTWTAIEGIQETLCGKFEALLIDLAQINQTIGVISGDQLEAFLGTCTTIEAISQNVLINMSFVCQLAQDTASDIDSIDSLLDMLEMQNETVCSKIEQLQVIVEENFAGTFTALEAVLEKACDIDNIVQSSLENIDTFTAIDALLEKACTIDGQIDQLGIDGQEILDTVCTVESFIDLNLGKLLDINGNVNVLDAQQDQLLVKTNNVLTQISAIESITDTVPLLTDTIESKLCVIESNVDLLDTRVETIESSIDFASVISTQIENNVCILEVSFDSAQDKLCTIESKVDILEQSSSSIETIVGEYGSLESRINTINVTPSLEKACTIESIIDVIDENLETALSFIATITLPQLVFSVDWSFDSSQLAVCINQSGGVDDLLFNYEFSNKNFFLADSVSFGLADRRASTVRWSPNKLILASGKVGAPGQSEIFTFSTDNNGIITQVDDDGFLGNTFAFAWHPLSQYIISGGRANIREITGYPVDASGNLGTPFIFDIAPDRDVGVHAIDWDPTGAYVVAGTEDNGVDPNFIILNFSETPSPSLSLNAGVTILGDNVDGVSWNPTSTSIIAISTNNPTTDNIRIYNHDGLEGTLTEITSISIDQIVAEVDWSPNGNYLAVVSAGSNSSLSVFYYNKLEKTLILLNQTSISSNGRDVRWDPSGRYIAVAVDTDVLVYEFTDSTALNIKNNLFVIENNININIDNVLNNIYIQQLTIESKIDAIFSDMESINQKTCTVESRVDVIDSSVHILIQNTNNIESNICALSDDFNETWTILAAIESKVCIVDMLANTVESELDTLNLGFDGTYTMIDLIQDKICSSESIIDSLVLDSPDFVGTFTVLELLVEKSCTIESSLDFAATELSTDDSQLADVLDCLGTEITNANVGTTGFTISASGHYFLGENIDYAASVAGNPAITISADNVTLDMCNRTVRQSNVSPNTEGIVISANSEGITIKNGVLREFTSDGIQMATGVSGIAIQDMRIVLCGGDGVGILGTADNILIDRVMVSNCSIDGITIDNGSDIIIQNSQFFRNSLNGININANLTASDRICVFRCMVSNNGGNGVVFNQSCTNSVLEGSYVFNNGSIGVAGNGFANSVLKNNIVVGSGFFAGIIMLGACNDVEILNNIILNNDGDGISMSNNAIEDCSVMGNILVLNTDDNYFEATNAAPHAILNNFAINTAEGDNYSQGAGSQSTINKSIINQGTGTFGTYPGKWRNISMTT